MFSIRSMVAACALAACSLAPLAQAQDRPPMGPGQGGMGGPGMGGPGGMRGPRMMGARPVITATDKYVYVLRGDTLFQFSADGLKPTGRVELPRPEPRDRPDGKGMPPKK